MRTFVSVIALCLCLLVAPSRWATEGTAVKGVDPVADVVQYIRDYLGPLRDGRYKRAPELARVIVEAARKHNGDYRLVAVVVQHESGFCPGASGSRGEVGLMQVHGQAAQGLDPKTSTAQEQVDVGTAWLVKCIDVCGGNIQQGLARYQSGSCTSKVLGARLRYAKYLAWVTRG